jgi:translation initiation factor 2 gamma subunit (eIF-2gamma)
MKWMPTVQTDDQFVIEQLLHIIAIAPIVYINRHYRLVSELSQMSIYRQIKKFFSTKRRISN